RRAWRGYRSGCSTARPMPASASTTATGCSMRCAARTPTSVTRAIAASVTSRLGRWPTARACCSTGSCDTAEREPGAPDDGESGGDVIEVETRGRRAPEKPSESMALKREIALEEAQRRRFWWVLVACRGLRDYARHAQLPRAHRARSRTVILVSHAAPRPETRPLYVLALPVLQRILTRIERRPVGWLGRASRRGQP